MSKLAHDIESTSKIRSKDVQICEDKTFDDLLLSKSVHEGLLNAGFKRPSPIQLKAIPLGRFGYDLIIKSKSGTGKTAVFSIIALEMININSKHVQVLILAPTREIAVQIQQVLTTLGEKIKGLKVEYFIGGTPEKIDKKKLEKCHIAVGAPGRIKSLIKRKILKTKNITLFVLDEADKLLEGTFQNDINYIFNSLEERKQVIASSATYSNELKSFLNNYMQSPVIINSNLDGNQTLLGLRQFVTVIKSHLNVLQQTALKNNELIRILQSITFNQCIIFSNNQIRAETIRNTLNNLGWPTAYISAAQNQKIRLITIESLKQRKCRILSSTDLTSRGIDAENVDLVINYEVPYDSETYLHRMGRAGRYGSRGICVTLTVEGNDFENFRNLLGNIGGERYFIFKYPTTTNIKEDLWTYDVSQFEKIFGSVNKDPDLICDSLSELTVNTTGNVLPNIEIPDEVEAMLQSINEEEIQSQIETKNKLLSQSPLSMLLNQEESTSSSDTVKKSKNKKAKTDEENLENKTGHNNSTYKNEAIIFQNSNILNKNLALHNITKLTVDPQETAIKEENISSTLTLLEILEQEDKCEKNPDDLLLLSINQQDKEEMTTNEPNIFQWIEVPENKVKTSVCKCSENLFSEAYLYAISKTEKCWESSICECHSEESLKTVILYEKKEVENEEMLYEEEENDEMYYEENEDEELYYEEEEEEEERDEEMYYEDEDDEKEIHIEEQIIPYDEEIFSKAYNFTLRTNLTPICSETSTEQISSGSPAGYASNYTNTFLQSYKTFKEPTQENNSTDSQFESYFEYYSNILAENGPYFTDSQSFEEWFHFWQQQVIETRNYIQKQIYQRESQNK